MIGNYGVQQETSAFAGVLATGVLDPVLKDMQAAGIDKLFFDRNPLLKEIKTLGDVNWDLTSRRATFTVEMTIPGSFTALDELEDMPRPSAGSFVQGEFYAKFFYGTFAITGQAFAQGTSKSALKDVVKNNFENMAKAIDFQTERMIAGDGSGVLCDVASYHAGTTTVTINQAGTHNITSLRFLQKNANVAWGAIANNAFTMSGSGVVLNKPRAEPTKFKIAIRAGNAPAQNDVFVMGDDRVNSYGKEMAGFQNFINATPDVFEGISGVTHDEWNAQAGDAGGMSFEPDIITQYCDDYEDVCDVLPKQILAPAELMRQYQQSMVQDIRFVPGSVLKGGNAGLEYVHAGTGTNIPLKRCRSMARDTAVFWDPSKVGFSWMRPWGWRSWDNGGIMRPAPDGKDAAFAYYQAYGNLACKSRRHLMGIANFQV